MRVKEIPKILFDRIVKVTNLEPYEMNLGEDRVCKVIFLKDEQAVIGYTESTHRKRAFTYLKVWQFYFGPNFEPDNFYEKIHDVPDFQITAGPFPGDVWAYGFGQNLIETVKIRYDYPFYGSGVMLDSPLVILVTSIMEIALKLIHINQPARLQYWEAFINPDADYTKPS